MLRRSGFLLLCSVLGFAQNAPTALTVVSASRSAVQLKWTGDSTASSYVIERRPLGSDSFSAILTLTETNATETNTSDKVFIVLTPFVLRSCRRLARQRPVSRRLLTAAL